MKKYIFILLSSYTWLAALPAVETEKPILEFEVSQGYRKDRLKIDGTLKGTSIKGHANLKNINIYETRLKTRLNIADYFLSLQGSYGEVRKSNSEFSVAGFHGKNSIALGFRGHHRITGGKAVDAKASFGREFYLNRVTSVSPMIGCLYGEEKINLHTISLPKLYWAAPFVGLGFKTKPGYNWSLYGEYNFAHLPLKKIKGYGNIGIVGIGYNFTKNIALKAEYELFDMKVHFTNRRIKAHGSLLSSTGRLILNLAV